MNYTTLTFCILILKISIINAKHKVYWNPNVTQRLSRRNILYHEVRIGELMDIICSDSYLAKTEFMKFAVYNVSKQAFHECSKPNEDAEKILSCDEYTMEKKITYKFQEFTPNPRGFVFESGKSYYLMGYTNDNETKSNQSNCNKVSRMEIKVYSNTYSKVLKKTELFTTEKRKIHRSLDAHEFKNRKLSARYAALIKGGEQTCSSGFTSNSKQFNVLLMSLIVAIVNHFSVT